MLNTECGPTWNDHEWYWDANAVLTCRNCGEVDETWKEDGVEAEKPENETYVLIEKFVKALTPMVTNETHAWNLWNIIASDNGDIRAALEHVWRKHDEFVEPATRHLPDFDEPVQVTTIFQLWKESGLTKSQVARLFGFSERTVYTWIANNSVPAREEERLASLITRIIPLGGTGDERRRALLKSSEGTSLFHQMVNEIPKAQVIQSSDLSVRDKLGVSED